METEKAPYNLERQEDEPPSPVAAVTAARTTSPATRVKVIYSAEPKGTSADWSDWRWQLRHRIRTLDGLRRFCPDSHQLEGCLASAQHFPMAITPYYASLIDSQDPGDPIFRMAVPQFEELLETPVLRSDPLEEDDDMPVPGLVHRYPDRALLLLTSTCGVYCRHCTRKRVAGVREYAISETHLEAAIQYLRSHPEIRDVILSGGDPLTLEDGRLEHFLAAVRSVETVDIIRIGTRTPVVLPMRITGSLTRRLRNYHPLYINTHFNHPREITAESRAACNRLADAGIPLGNQSVLLRGVNDDPEVIERLCRDLIRMRVRPYYLFQCDLVRGVEHFRTPLSKGIEIMEYLRGRLSGLAIPTFVVDAPHGGGKIPVLPNYIVSMSPTHTVLRNFEGMMVSYPEPLHRSSPPLATGGDAAAGVWELASGRGNRMEPAGTQRQQRRSRRGAIPDDPIFPSVCGRAAGRMKGGNGRPTP